ncbi:hypothetical protein ACFFSW_30785 [Saccharothrix longispora]|uniref:Glucose dehydrogenase C-terminal domain-containing protein n=1 Tax=Saccharothrix longispora TaxID=33920 RepID=A0ABU1PUG5_9PSEU|nr:hypothetical protein [Saccharothrix longispora]MDR6594287.1 hypothetical protein [Saccharothrix longispora]
MRALTATPGTAGSSKVVELPDPEPRAGELLENDVVVGSVNADLRHHRQAAEASARAHLGRPGGLITRRVPPESFADASGTRPDDVEVVVTLDGGR